MATLYTHKDQNIAKTWVLMFVFLCVVIGVGWAVSYYFNNPSILFFAVVLAVVMNVTSYWFSDKLVVAIAGAKPADEREYSELHNVVENLAITAGLPKPKVYIINDPAPNAFATGRDPKHAAVCATTGLLNILEDEELEGVMAHEMAHVRNRDVRLMTLVAVLVGAVALISDMLLRIALKSRIVEKQPGGKHLVYAGKLLVGQRLKQV